MTFLGNEIFHHFVSYLFVGLKYILITLVIDLIIISNILVINHIIQKVRNFRIYHYEQRSNNIKYMIAILTVVDLVILGIFYGLDIYILIMWILLIEMSIAAIGALGVWLIVYSV